jgi:protein tyrosine phosphatase (PTP) superfamily phosphohydrolase (DUF442 family)
VKKMATCIALVCLTSAVAVAGQQNTTLIMNFFRINTEFCTGGQPTIEQLSALKADGVKTIINLRTPMEYDPAPEIAKAKELGLRYFNIPVASSGPKDEQVVEFLKLTDDPQNRPAFIHCASANRVGAFTMIRRVLRDNWTMEAAKAEADKIGLRSQNLVDFATQYIQKNKKQ